MYDPLMMTANQWFAHYEEILFSIEDYCSLHGTHPMVRIAKDASLELIRLSREAVRRKF